LNISFT